MRSVKYIIISAFALCGLMPVQGENYLQNGLTWEQRVSGGAADPFFEGRTFHHFEEIGLENGEKALVHYEADTEGERGLPQDTIIVEGPKVYIFNRNLPENKGLIYDFSMNPGDVADIVFPFAKSLEESISIRCVSREMSEKFPNLEIMRMIEDRYADDESSYICGTWICGLGNTGLLVYCPSFNAISGGPGYDLDNVRLNGDLIYRANGTNDVKEIATEKLPVDTVYYDMQGRRITTPQSKGVYIRVYGDTREKIMIP